MQIPTFLEANHPLVKSLSTYSDQELINLFQQHPDQGKFFVALFCRYSAIVYSVIHHGTVSPVQKDYLFTCAWEQIWAKLKTVNLEDNEVIWQTWLINITGEFIEQINIPHTNNIRYSLTAVPPPFWCYLNQALTEIPVKFRLMIIMAQTYKWNHSRIADYFQAAGEMITLVEIPNYLQQGYELLTQKIPADIQEIYLK